MSDRTVYRDNWYLDAWCHLGDGLRAFSVDAIKHPEILDKRAKDVADKRLDKVLGAGYGIFSGEEASWATLRFSPERSRWVSLLLSGCMLFTLADAAVTVVATTVKVGAKVVGTTVDVAAAGVKAVAGSEEKKKDKD